MQLEFISHLYCLFYAPCNRLLRLTSHTERETKFREELGVDETFVVGDDGDGSGRGLCSDDGGEELRGGESQ